MSVPHIEEVADSEHGSMGHALPGAQRQTRTSMRGHQVCYEKRRRMVYDTGNKRFYPIEVWLPMCGGLTFFEPN